MEVSKYEILKTASELVIDIDNLTMNEIEEKYLSFKQKFPKLYQIIIQGPILGKTNNQIISELSIILGIREEVKSGLKDGISANVQVGEYMAKQYLYPVIGTPTIEQKKNALDKIVKGSH
jgi:hypothetical protein